jgi:hypothetical protein
LGTAPDGDHLRPGQDAQVRSRDPGDLVWPGCVARLWPAAGTLGRAPRDQRPAYVLGENGAVRVSTKFLAGCIALLILAPLVTSLWWIADGGAGERPATGSSRDAALPVGDAATCDELAADSLFGGQASPMVVISSGVGRPQCTLDVIGTPELLDTLDIEMSCLVGTPALVVVYQEPSGAWFVDHEQTHDLDAANCPPPAE